MNILGALLVLPVILSGPKLIPQARDVEIVEKEKQSFVYYSTYFDENTNRIEKIKMDEEWQYLLYTYCVKHNVNYEWVLALTGAESSFNPFIGKSKNGKYYGAGMINIKYMKDYLKKEYGVNLLTPEGGLEGICILLREHLDSFGDDYHKASMAYNFGAGYAKKLIKQGITSSRYSRRIESIMNNLKAEEDIYG